MCFKHAIVLIVLILLVNCGNTTTEPATTDFGDVNLSIVLGNVGSLGKATAIDLEILCIEIKKDTSIIRDTVSVSGNSQTMLNSEYNDLLVGVWSVTVKSFDTNDIAIHVDSSNFIITPNNTTEVNLTLASKYTMLIANFVGIADSVTSCELLVDDVMVAESSFDAQSNTGATVTLTYDYLSTGIQHNIKMDVYGTMWGADYKLYTAETSILVEAGIDDSYSVDLVWVGPDDPPPGSATVEITIGALGSITVDGNIIAHPERVMDTDGNLYKTAVIGGQIWMAENLKVTHYRDGTSIPNVTDSGIWAGLTTDAYCIYNNNSSNEVDTYGALYNWYAVNGDIDGDGVKDKEIAPDGWHVPTDEEWQTLEIYLGMDAVDADVYGWRGTNEASKLAGNIDLWGSGVDAVLANDPEFGSSGFDALSGGQRFESGAFISLGSEAVFWNATPVGGYRGLRHLMWVQKDVLRSYSGPQFGQSVRCVKD